MGYQDPLSGLVELLAQYHAAKDDIFGLRMPRTASFEDAPCASTAA
jgi:hypothetical protein